MLYRASKHDSVLFVSTYHELLHWYPEWRFGESILDSAFDAYPIYEMLEQYDVSAIIDLNPRRSKQFTYHEMDINLDGVPVRSEEHTSELQSRGHLVCRLLLEKKKKITHMPLPV